MKLEDKLTSTISSILYILQKLGSKGDFHKIFKILYFADQKHLTRYGSLISDDQYIAMNNGPVPSMAYDILKALRNEGLLAKLKNQVEPYFELISDYMVGAKVSPDLDELSESELSCIDEAIKENKDLDFPELTRKSHDAAWKKALQDCEIKIDDIAEAGGANKDMIEYINHVRENQNAGLG